MKKIFLLVLFAVLLPFVPAGCGGRPETSPVEPKVRVYASFYPLYDFTQKIGGRRVEVLNLVPAGVEPHEWEPGPQVIAGLLQADLLFYNGLGMEPWIGKIADTLKAGKVLAVNTSEGVEPLWGYTDHHHDEDEHGEDEDEHGHPAGDLPDPHIWLDPLLALHQAERILLALIKVDPAHEGYYRENFTRFREQVEALDAAYRDGLRERARNEFIVTHRSFAYLARRYGLVQVGISGLTPHAEPTPGELREIVDFIREHSIRYIFREPLAAPALAEVLAAETGVQILTLNPLEGLTKEEMDSGLDYFTVMYENLKQLKKALSE